MKRMIACIAIAFLLGGCAVLKDRLCGDRSGTIAEAVAYLEKGNETAAAKLLEEVVNDNERGRPGVDEALFRLSLLELRNGEETSTVKSIQKRLARLQSEYPDSQWTRMSWPLTEYITQSESLKSELRSIRQKYSSASKETRELAADNQQLQGTIQTLTKENKELNQLIEKLKSLDLELEKKNRR